MDRGPLTVDKGLWALKGGHFYHQLTNDDSQCQTRHGWSKELAQGRLMVEDGAFSHKIDSVTIF